MTPEEKMPTETEDEELCKALDRRFSSVVDANRIAMNNSNDAGWAMTEIARRWRETKAQLKAANAKIAELEKAIKEASDKKPQ